MNKGWREAIEAAIIAVVVATILAIALFWLMGCAGASVGAKLEHHSSAQDNRDVCEDNLLGIDFRSSLDYFSEGCGDHCVELVIGLGWDVRGGACQGRDPIGELNIRVPIWTKHD